MLLGDVSLHVLVAADLARVSGIPPFDVLPAVVALSEPEVPWGKDNKDANFGSVVGKPQLDQIRTFVKHDQTKR